MKKELKKKRLVLLFVGALVMAQLPNGYVSAEETNVVSESSQVIDGNKEQVQGTDSDDEVNISGEVIDKKEAENESIVDESNNNNINTFEQNDTNVVDESIEEDKKNNEIEALTATANTDGFDIEGTTLKMYTGSATSIIIPDGITTIEGSAFEGRRSLTSITIPNSVTSIGFYAFKDCVSLTSITIPDGVTSIGESTFENCFNLTSVTLPEGITDIGEYAFAACGNLTSITIPDGVTHIGSFAFAACSRLTSITIPSGVSVLAENVFAGCSNVTSITIPDGVTCIGDSAFWNCSNLTSITIPDSVTEIDDDAFKGCISLASITIPDSVTSIGTSVFKGCVSLADSNGFIVVKNVLYEYIGTATSITIPDGVTSIGDSAFSDLSSLTSITLSDGVISIGSWAFSGCSSLTSITIPDSVTYIGNCTFNGCSSLTSITIPNSVTSIGKDVFAGCSGGKIKIKKKATDKAGEYFTIYCNTNSYAYKYAKEYKKCGIIAFEYKEYKIKYKLNKGTNADTNPTYYVKGTKVKLAKPTRKDYKFVGWYIGETKVTSISKTTTGKVTLTAKWEKVSTDKTTVKSAKNKKEGEIKVTFDKVSGAKGYTVYYSTNKNLENASTFDVSSEKKSTTIKELEKGKTYYVTVKAYKLDSQKNKVYGKSNKTIRVEVKK